jgi:tartrate dehydrogenase/decarboxylase/D-malate dehydrogenase
MKEIRLAVIPGDGIGKETVAAGKNVLDAVADVHGGFRFRYEQFDWSCEYYAKHGRMMPENGLDLLRPHDAIFLGAVGYPGVPDHISLWGLLIPIRRTFQQYINLRPVKLLPGVRTPLANRGPEDIDFFVVRENNEGEYSNMGGRLYEGQPNEIVVQNTVFTRLGVERVVRYAFELARKTGRKRVTSATKSNGINITMPYWDEIFWSLAKEYPDIEADQFHIDALVARFVTHPEHFDVVVGSNLFGDILSDLGPAIAGKGIANPMGQIWCAAMMLEHLGFPEAGDLVMGAMKASLAKGISTPDIGGMSNTREVTATICDHLRRPVSKG